MNLRMEDIKRRGLVIRDASVSAGGGAEGVILVVLVDNNVSHFNYVTPRNTQLCPPQDSHPQKQ